MQVSWAYVSGVVKREKIPHVIKKDNTSTNLSDSFDPVAVVEISALTIVRENARLLRVCLNVRTPGPRRSCPVTFQFTVSIVKEDVTTGLLSFKTGVFCVFQGLNHVQDLFLGKENMVL